MCADIDPVSELWMMRISWCIVKLERSVLLGSANVHGNNNENSWSDVIEYRIYMFK